MENILEVKNLTVKFKKDKEIFTAVNDVTFDIRKGEIMGLCGESGCGKSSLSRALLYINKKGVTGEIKHNSSHPQMVFQDPKGSLNPAKKVGFLLEEPLKIKGGFTKEERRERVLSMLQHVELTPDLLDRYPSELSGGQRQRICIAESLMQEPEFIILDEPVSALDVTVQSQILKLLKKLKEELNLSMLFISHDLRVVYDLCDRVMIMKDGVIVERGDKETVFKNPQDPYTKKLMEAAKTKYVKD